MLLRSVEHLHTSHTIHQHNQYSTQCQQLQADQGNLPVQMPSLPLLLPEDTQPEETQHNLPKTAATKPTGCTSANLTSSTS